MRALITGSSGIIGRVLISGLTWDKTPFDLPADDVRQYDRLVTSFAGHDAVIHLAWDTQSDNYRADFHHPDNALQVVNVYRAAVEAGVRRVIMASSVHADKFTDRAIDGLLDPYALPVPDSPYGAGKCFMEALGRYYADSKDLEVVCLRFGGVNSGNEVPDGSNSERHVWLSHADCVQLVQKCLDADSIPGNYAIIYGVSNNADRIHDYKNPVGWMPRDGAGTPIRRS
ncbi:NAD(P)-dependent oxidoreductase [Nocardia amamiensis]|uniref:NAD(P)-dependent oxidoreductase n=1 Tax=Nocardia amamiensis TaxID=404578 RepID=A0ABS0CX06_9NOCA|nr:NAD(P)-dependent oxidoreductase [Nocardia amamiensis]MBF6300896.1 NAD(P)-dependent oxidoreductase [Nocardia amamiensis]